jgi:hypothetical protein
VVVDHVLHGSEHCQQTRNPFIDRRISQDEWKTTPCSYWRKHGRLGGRAEIPIRSMNLQCSTSGPKMATGCVRPHNTFGTGRPRIGGLTRWASSSYGAGAGTTATASLSWKIRVQDRDSTKVGLPEWPRCFARRDGQIWSFR